MVAVEGATEASPPRLGRPLWADASEAGDLLTAQAGRPAATRVEQAEIFRLRPFAQPPRELARLF